METFTFLFTDIEGSTALVQRLGERLYAQVLADHHAVIRSGLAAHAIATTQRSGDQYIACILTENAGVNALRAGNIPAARAYLEQAAQGMQAIGDEDPNAFINMGWVLRQEGDADAARASFQQALRIGRRTGHGLGIAGASLGLAWLAADTGDWHPGSRTARRRASLPRPGRTPRGKSLKHATARPAWTRYKLTSARSSSSEPTPPAWRSAPAKPST